MGGSSVIPFFAPHTCLLICKKSLAAMSLSTSISLKTCSAVKQQLQAHFKRQAERSF